MKHSLLFVCALMLTACGNVNKDVDVTQNAPTQKELLMAELNDIPVQNDACALSANTLQNNMSSNALFDDPAFANKCFLVVEAFDEGESVAASTVGVLNTRSLMHCDAQKKAKRFYAMGFVPLFSKTGKRLNPDEIDPYYKEVVGRLIMQVAMKWEEADPLPLDT